MRELASSALDIYLGYLPSRDVSKKQHVTAELSRNSQLARSQGTSHRQLQGSKTHALFKASGTDMKLASNPVLKIVGALLSKGCWYVEQALLFSVRGVEPRCKI